MRGRGWITGAVVGATFATAIAWVGIRRLERTGWAPTAWDEIKAVHQARVDDGERIHHVLAVPRLDDRPVPLHAEGGGPGRDHREPGLVLAQQHEPQALVNDEAGLGE